MIPYIQTKAATREEINATDVYLKQEGRNTCTLSSAAMMLRRAAYLSGKSDWNKITESSIKSTAWTSGLKNNFTYDGMNVVNAKFKSSGDKTSELIELLENHPEGIVIHKQGSGQHAVLLTDYTDGVFYCADPVQGRPLGRIPLSLAYSVTVNNISQYWYIKSPKIPEYNNNNPVGVIDSCGADYGEISVNGWAFDKDDCSKSLEIHVYIGGGPGSGAPGYKIIADKERKDVNQVYGTGEYHGYEGKIKTDLVGRQTLYIYAINIGHGENILLGTREVDIPIDNSAPQIINAKITGVDYSGYTVSCEVEDNTGVDRVQFPTWTVYNGQDDITSNWQISSAVSGQKDGDTYYYRVNIKDHNDEKGEYVTHIYAYDKYGNYSAVEVKATVPSKVESIAIVDENGLSARGVVINGYNSSKN